MQRRVEQLERQNAALRMALRSAQALVTEALSPGFGDLVVDDSEQASSVVVEAGVDGNGVGH